MYVRWWEVLPRANVCLSAKTSRHMATPALALTSVYT